MNTSDGKVIINVTRNGLVECQYQASIVVVNYKEEIIFSTPKHEKMLYLRSLAKPFQALPLFETGAVQRFKLSDADLAIIVSSHNGENIHINQVRSILKRAGLTEGALKCGTHPPFLFKITKVIFAEYGKIMPIHNNCSGKHAGMLLLSKQLGVSTCDYDKLEHPAQKLILDQMLRMFNLELNNITLGVDGCGVPTIAVPFTSVAHAYAMFAWAEKTTHLGILRNAMISHPDLIAGNGRMETALMKQLPYIAKSGAGGLMAVAIPNRGLGIVVKVDSGLPIIAELVILNALKKFGYISDLDTISLKYHYSPKVLDNRGEPVGRYEVIWP